LSAFWNFLVMSNDTRSLLSHWPVVVTKFLSSCDEVLPLLIFVCLGQEWVADWLGLRRPDLFNSMHPGRNRINNAQFCHKDQILYLQWKVALHKVRSKWLLPTTKDQSWNHNPFLKEPLGRCNMVFQLRPSSVHCVLFRTGRSQSTLSFGCERRKVCFAVWGLYDISYFFAGTKLSPVAGVRL